MTSGKPLRPYTLSQKFWYQILRLFGWSMFGELPDLPKYVAIFAPHTSNWDVILLLVASRAVDLPFPHWIGKHTLFWGPMGWLWRRLGGMPLNRGASRDFVLQIVAEFQRRDRMILGISPEGTRRHTDYWRSGFYHIAHGAGVPVVMVSADYARKVGRMAKPLWLTGHVEADMAQIAAFYAGVKGLHPQNQGPVRLRPSLRTLRSAADSSI